MNDKMVTIRLPERLCQAFADLAEYAGDCEDADAARAVSWMLATAAKKGGLQLDSSLLDTYKPYDEETGQGGLLDRKTILRFKEAMLKLLQQDE